MAQISTDDSIDITQRLRLKGNRAALAGHSMMQQALERQLTGTADTRRLLRYLDVTTLGALSEGRLVFPESLAAAVSGWTSTQILNTVLTATTAPNNPAAVGKTQLDYLISLAPDIIFLMGYHNDVSNSVPLDTTKANHIALAQKAVDAGIPIVFPSNTPVGSTLNTPQRQTGATLRASMNFRNWLLNELPYLPGFEGKVFAVDLFAPLQDRSTGATDGDGNPAVLSDGVHRATAGGIIGGRRLLRGLEPLLPPRRVPRVGVRGDVYNSADNIRGNLLGAAGNIADAGTAISGTQGGVTLAGVKPTSWPNLNLSGTFQAGSGITYTGSMVDLPGGGRVHRINVQGTAGPNGGNFELTPGSISLANLLAGDRIGFFGNFSVAAGGTGLACIGSRITSALPNGEFDVVAIGECDTATKAMDLALALEAFVGTWNGDISHLVTKNEVTVTPSIYARVAANATLNFTIDLWDPAVRSGCLA